MTVRTAVRNPLIAGALGIVLGAAPLAALYGVATPTTAHAQGSTPPAAVTSAQPRGGVSVMLPDFTTLVKRYGPAVVNIRVIEKAQDEGSDNPFGPNSPFAPFFRGLPFQAPPQQEPIRGEGSGFVIRSDGLILTNAHVVEGATRVTVQLTDRREYSAKVIGVDKTSDVAVIKIPVTGLQTVTLGDSNTLQVGQWVLAIGAPFGFENSATAGIVSAKGRTLPDSGYVPFIQTDVPINPGNSGGPLFDMQGKVIGINSQIYSRSGGYMGVSFSIPIDVAMQVAHQILTTGHVERGKLGVVIQNVDQGLADSFGLPQPEGALVSSVEDNGAAARAGVQPGDVILALNGEPVQTSSQLPVRIASLMPGTTVRLTIWRNHSQREISVKLASMGDETVASAQNPQQQGGSLGLAVRPLTHDEQEQTHTHGGLLVEGVSGPSEDAGIQPGDVVLAANGVRVGTVDQLRSAVEKSKGHVALLIERGGTRIFVPVQVK
ncbi:MAG TPA: DegQ family serine endoprotease [Steroidobacteraceae bacterium]|nr:DegQ family serine endoprotease [Steroidobacteraceae bacterium]